MFGVFGGESGDEKMSQSRTIYALTGCRRSCLLVLVMRNLLWDYTSFFLIAIVFLQRACCIFSSLSEWFRLEFEEYLDGDICRKIGGS